jgi:hypothetical protein
MWSSCDTPSGEVPFISPALLNKIWSFLATVLLYLTLNVWSLTQQWQLAFTGNPFKADSVTAAQR